MTKFLVAYASKYRSTAEIAQRIGKTLRAFKNYEVDVQSVDAVQKVSSYDVIVIGSAVYMGQWQAEAANFLEEHERELTERITWLFSSGPTGEGNPQEILKGWTFPNALQPLVDRIKPHGITLFHGKVDPDQMNFLERVITKSVNARTGDFRDWDMIDNWALKIAKMV
ncbi:MAG: flavodoxin domain-containing protein [Anaerolineae bacterium]|nr:flavodoxin domain-containing protein [Anaerolineae bacterium]